MTLLQLLALLEAANETVARLTELVDRLRREAREPTPEEVEQVKARQRQAEQAWAAALPP